MCVEGVPRDVSRVFQWSFEFVLRVFQVCQGNVKVFLGCFEGVLMIFQGGLKGI